MVFIGHESRVHQRHGLNMAVYHHGIPGAQTDIYAHWHDEYEIMYVYDGSLDFNLDNRPYNLKAGEMLFVNKNQLHSCYNFNDDSKLLCIVFGDSYVFSNTDDRLYKQYILPVHSQNRIFPSFISNEMPWGKKIIHHAKDILDSYLEQSSTFDMECRALLLMIFSEIIKHETTTYDNVRYSSTTNVVRDAITYIGEHYAEIDRVSELSEQFGVSNEHFCRIFKRATGQTPGEYLTTSRINKACQMIVMTDDNITRVASNVGYNDINYFSRIFKRICNMTPSEYRKMHLT